MKRILMLAALVTLCFSAAQAQNSISLEQLAGTVDGNIQIGTTVNFQLRVTAATDLGLDKLAGTTIGFRIYSPGGASWTGTTGEFLPAWPPQGSGGFDLLRQVASFGADGIGADTIAFNNSTLFGAGAPAGYDEVAWQINAEIPNDPELHNQELCIDSCSFVGPARLNWLWNDGLGAEIFPSWSGEQCFTIVDPNAAGGELGVTPDTLTFTVEEGSGDPTGQTFTVSEGSGGNIPFAVSTGASWFTVLAQGSTTPADVNVDVITSGLGVGTYFDSVEVSSGDADNSPVYKYVSLEITAAPSFGFTPDTLFFAAEVGSPNPANQNIDIDLSDASARSITLTPIDAMVSVDPTTGSTPLTVAVGVDITGLTPGVYTDSVLVTEDIATDKDAETAQAGFFFVVTTITEFVEPFALAADPTSLTFNATEGDGVLPMQSVAITEALDRAIDFGATNSEAWLSLSVVGTQTPGSIEATVDATGLAVGTYEDTIVVSSSQADDILVPVTLEVAAAPEFARLQVIHNAADPSVGVVDVWVNNEVLLNDFGFREATPFIDVAAGVDLLVGVSLPDSSGYNDIGTYNLTAGVPYILIANGVLEPTLFEANPDGRSIAFELFALANAREAGVNGAGNVDFAVLHGATDAPTVDVFARDVAKLVEDAAYGDIAPYQFVPTGEYILDVALGSDSTVVAGSFLADLNGLGGGAALVFASGFLTPINDQNGAAFGLFAALPDGNVVEFPPYVEPNELVVIPEIFSIFATEGDTDPVLATLQVSEANDRALPFSLSTALGSTWLSFSKTAGTTGPTSDPDSTVVSFDPTGLAAGNYYDTILVVLDDGSDTAIVLVDFAIEEFVCTNILLSDTLLTYSAFEGSSDTDPALRTLAVTGSEQSISFVFDASVEMSVDWVTLINGADTGATVTGVNGDILTVLVDPSALAVGTHTASVAVMSESPDVCVPALRTFEVQVTVNEVIVPSDDTVRVVNTPAVPGMSVMVPVQLTNSCNTSEAFVPLAFDSANLVFDSASFENSVFAMGEAMVVSGDLLFLTLSGDGTPAMPGVGTMAQLYFTVRCEAAPGFYALDLAADQVDCIPLNELCPYGLRRNCGTGEEVEAPEFEVGGIVVDSVDNYVCGYVVDTAGNEIEGATVQLWGDFPIGMPIDEMLSTGIGSFAFSDFMTIPFSLYAYKDGYYPTLAEGLNFGDKGIMLVLTPLPDLTPTSEWVDYFCNTNTYRGQPLPVGAVVEAYANGLLVGRDVVETEGSYGFMPVYRDDFTTGEVDGAVAGDNIMFMVNGQAAVADGNTEYPADYQQVQVCLSAGDQVTQECVLGEGWNLVSWRVQTETSDIMDVLGPYMNNIDVVLGFERGGLTYDPELPEFSTLWNTDHLSGYWIRVKEGMGFTLEINGTAVPVSTPIPVTAGWNLVSYLPEMAMAPVDALVSLDGILLYAYGWDGGILTYEPGSQFSNLVEMMTCNGYWVKVSTNGELVYPSGGGPVLAANIIPTRETVETASSGFVSDVKATTQWMNLYSRNLTLDGTPVAAGTEIAAHRSDGMRIGSFVVRNSGEFGFMPVYGSVTGDNAGIKPGDEFSLTVGGKETKETFTWTSNGDRMEIGNLSAASQSGGDLLPDAYDLAQNYPNPFNPTTTISFTLPAAGKVKLEVYNILGKLVATPFDGQASSGMTEVVWDGRDLRGETVSSGVYFYRLTTDTFTDTKKMMLLK